MLTLWPVNTPRFRSNALLSRVTRADQQRAVRPDLRRFDLSGSHRVDFRLDAAATATYLTPTFAKQ